MITASGYDDDGARCIVIPSLFFFQRIFSMAMQHCRLQFASMNGNLNFNTLRLLKLKAHFAFSTSRTCEYANGISKDAIIIRRNTASNGRLEVNMSLRILDFNVKVVNEICNCAVINRNLSSTQNADSRENSIIQMDLYPIYTAI